jgi:hypothetical protein
MFFWVGFLCGGVGGPWRALGNPSAYFFDIGDGNTIALWRHALVGIGGHQESQERALVGFAGDDVGRVKFTTGEGGLGAIETVAGLLLFGTMALDTMPCEKGFDFGLKVDGARAGDQEDSGDESGVEQLENGG